MIKPRRPPTGETALQEARRIANYLLATMPASDREAFTTRAHAAGIMWLGAQTVVYDDDQAITTDLAAELAGVTRQTIHDWARTPHPDGWGRMLLPKHGKVGRNQTYLVAHIREAAHLAASSRLPRRLGQDRPVDEAA